MRRPVSRIMAPLQGSDLMSLVEAYLTLAPGGDRRRPVPSSVTVPCILEWRTDGGLGRGELAWPVDAFGFHGSGVRRLIAPNGDVLLSVLPAGNVTAA